MKKIFLLGILAVPILAIKAQKEPGSLCIQPMVGLNVANFMDASSSSPKLGFTGGIEFEGFLTKNLSMSLAGLFSMQGANYDLWMLSWEEVDFSDLKIEG